MSNEGCWAISFACCAATNDFEDVEHKKSPSPLPSDQPRRISAPQYQPCQNGSATDDSMRAHQRGKLGCTSFATTRRPWTSTSHKRLKIGEPTDFRRLSDMPKRRHSFSPLELSIHVASTCRLSPLPDFGSIHWSAPTNLEEPAAVLLVDRTSTELDRAYTDSVTSESSSRLPKKPVSLVSADIDTYHHNCSNGYASKGLPWGISSVLVPSHLPFAQRTSTVTVTEPLPVIVRPGSQRLHQRTLSAAASSFVESPTTRTYSTTEPSSRKPSIRRVKNDVEEVIKELNTIVEERRLDAIRTASRRATQKLEHQWTEGTDVNLQATNSQFSPTTSPTIPSPHVPAIVPTMKVHARSETLSDIGSAFSTPLVNKRLPTPPSDDALAAQPGEDPFPRSREQLSVRVQPCCKSPTTTCLSSIPPTSVVHAKGGLFGLLRNSSRWVGHDELHLATAPSKELPPLQMREQAEDLSPYCPPSSMPVLPAVPMAPRNSSTHVPARSLSRRIPFVSHLDKRAARAVTVARRRGLSIGTLDGVPPPPAYEAIDPHPKSATSIRRESLVGVAY